MSVSQLAATVEAREKDAKVQQAHLDLASGRITAAEAQRRCDEAREEYSRACLSGLHFEI